MQLKQHDMTSLAVISSNFSIFYPAGSRHCDGRWVNYSSDPFTLPVITTHHRDPSESAMIGVTLMPVPFSRAPPLGRDGHTSKREGS